MDIKINEKVLKYLERYARKEDQDLNSYINQVLVNHIKEKLNGDEGIKDEIYEESLRKLGLTEDDIENIVYGGGNK